MVERYGSIYYISKNELLFLDNELSHLANLDNLSVNVRIEYIPMNTSLLLPMDQVMIANFKTCYIRKKLLNDLCKQLPIRDFWKKFNIIDAVDNIT